jgi:hypothetical protein
VQKSKLFLLIAENLPPTIFRDEGYLPLCGKKTVDTTKLGENTSCSTTIEGGIVNSTRASYIWDTGRYSNFNM